MQIVCPNGDYYTCNMCRYLPVPSLTNYEPFRFQNPIFSENCVCLETVNSNSFFSRESNLYFCLYNQLFALIHYVFKFLTL